MPTNQSLKLVVVGDGSGRRASNSKTLFLVTATIGYPEEYCPTVFDNYVLNCSLPEIDTKIDLGLWVCRFKFFDLLNHL